MQQSHTFASHTSQPTSQSLQKSVPAQPHRHSDNADRQTTTERRAACNSSYKKLAVLWLNEALCINQSLCLADSFVLRNPPLRKAAKRYFKMTDGLHRLTNRITKIYESNR